MMTAAEIARALGAKPAGRNHWMARCPAHADRTPSLAIRQGAMRALVCYHAGCPQEAVIEALRHRGLWDAPRRDERPRRFPVAGKPTRAAVSCETPSDRDAELDRRLDFMRQLWLEGHDPRGTLAELYLAGRGLKLDGGLAGRVLRFHAACPFGEGVRVPALLAAFSPIENDPGEDEPPVALLRVGLDEHGGKFGKKMIGPTAAAAIKIDADEDVTYGLGICEGLEDALDIRQRGWRPVWCVGSAGAIKTFPILAGVDCLTIFADNDASGVGLDRARACADAWRAADREVAIIPPRGAKDWNEAGR
jgi:putative DNA primase/helicase